MERLAPHAGIIPPHSWIMISFQHSQADWSWHTKTQINCFLTEIDVDHVNYRRQVGRMAKNINEEVDIFFFFLKIANPLTVIRFWIGIQIFLHLHLIILLNIIHFRKTEGDNKRKFYLLDNLARKTNNWDLKSEFSKIYFENLQSELFSVAQNVAWPIRVCLWGERCPGSSCNK